MRCPYCVSEIADEALACPRCARDLYLFKPLLAKIEQLEKTVAEQAKSAAAGAEQRIAALEEELAKIKAERAEAIPVEVAIQPSRAAAPSDGYLGGIFQALVPVLVLLLVAHGVLLFMYDVKPLYLRIATILLPMPFGFLLARHFPGHLWTSAAAGFVTAVLAVLGMLTIAATIDKVPLLPQDARDWRETLEYVASIGLAVFTGLLAGEFYAAFKQSKIQPPKVIVLIAKAVTPNEDGEFGIERAAKRIDKVYKAATPAVTGAASVYAGIKAFLGDLG
ncbi:MAG: hypothetical protein WAO95_16070 [Burkholderiales bacterium]